MDCIGFRRFLENDENIVSKKKAVNSRISKSSWVERKFSVNLDDVVKKDFEFEHLLFRIKCSNDSHLNKCNSIRKYYKFKNGKSYTNNSRRAIMGEEKLVIISREIWNGKTVIYPMEFINCKNQGNPIFAYSLGDLDLLKAMVDWSNNGYEIKYEENMVEMASYRMAVAQ